VLENNQTFNDVRKRLSQTQGDRFCSAHRVLPAAVQSTFTLHRDILHCLQLPLLHIRSQAAVYAFSLISSQRSGSTSPTSETTFDLEVVFREDARTAFSWLQCFVTEEADWMTTKGCPACIVQRVLHDEPYIRIVVAACILSTHLRRASQTKAPQEIPDFSFWHSAVRNAVVEDEFWGLHLWSDIEARARGLEKGIRQLISQCSSSLYHTSPPGRILSPPRVVSASIRSAFGPGVQNNSVIQIGTILRRQEQEWMRNIIEACCPQDTSDSLEANMGTKPRGRSIVPLLRSYTR